MGSRLARILLRTCSHLLRPAPRDALRRGPSTDLVLNGSASEPVVPAALMKGKPQLTGFLFPSVRRQIHAGAASRSLTGKAALVCALQTPGRL